MRIDNLFRRLLVVVVVFALFACGAATYGGTIAVDTFDTPDPGKTFIIPGMPPWGDENPLARTDTLPSMVERDLVVEVVGIPQQVSAVGVIGYEQAYDRGVFRLGTLGSAGTQAILQYHGPTGMGPISLDLTDDGANDRLELAFNYVDPGFGETMDVHVTVGAPDGTTSTVGLDVAETEGPVVVEVPFADFTPNLFSTVSSLTFTFNDGVAPAPNVDFELDGIQAVPEPSAIVSLCALGALALAVGTWRWRRR